jgi:hypothetical protein
MRGTSRRYDTTSGAPQIRIGDTPTPGVGLEAPMLGHPLDLQPEHLRRHPGDPAKQEAEHDYAPDDHRGQQAVDYRAGDQDPQHREQLPGVKQPGPPGVPDDRHQIESVGRRDPVPGIVVNLPEDQITERPVNVHARAQMARGCRIDG